MKVSEFLLIAKRCIKERTLLIVRSDEGDFCDFVGRNWYFGAWLEEKYGDKEIVGDTQIVIDLRKERERDVT